MRRRRPRPRRCPRMSAPFTTADGRPLRRVVAAVYAPRRRDRDRGAAPGRPARLRERHLPARRAWRRPRCAGLPEGTRIHVRDGDATVIGDGGAGRTAAGTIDVAGRRWTVAVSGVAGPSAALPVGRGRRRAPAGRRRGAAVRGVGRARARRARDELAGLRVRHDLILSVGGRRHRRRRRRRARGLRQPGRGADARLERRRAHRAARSTTASCPSLGPRCARAAPCRARRRCAGATARASRASTPPARSPTARAKGAVVTFRDVTARKRLETQTLESLAAAEELAADRPPDRASRTTAPSTSACAPRWSGPAATGGGCRWC